MTDRNKIILVVILITVSFGCGYFAKPSKVVTKIEEKVVIKEVVKTVTEVKTNVVTVVKEVKAPDGTTTIETRTEDKTQTDNNTQTVADTTKTTIDNSTVTNDKGLTVQALALGRITDFTSLEYGALIKKRIIGNVSDRKSVV